MVSNNLALQKSTMLRIMVFTDHLRKITLTINRGSFMALGNRWCLQTLAKQTNAKLNMLQ